MHDGPRTDAAGPREAAQRRRIVQSSQIMVVAGLVAVTGNIGITLMFDVWQLDAIILCLFVLIGSYAFVVIPRARAGRLVDAVRFAIRMVVGCVVWCSLLMAGTAISLSLTAFVTTLAIAPGVLSFREMNRTMLVTTTIGIALVTADALGPPFSARFPLFQAWLYIMTTAAMICFVLLVLRDFKQYPLTTKLQVSFLIVALGGVGLYTIISAANARDERMAEVEARLGHASVAAVRLVDAALDEARARALADARAPGLSAADGERAAAALAELRRPGPRPAVGAALLGPTGEVRASAGDIDASAGPPPTGVRAALVADGIAVEAPVPGPDGAAAGTLRARYAAEALREALAELATVTGPGTAVAVLGPDGATLLRVASAGATDDPEGEVLSRVQPLRDGGLRVVASCTRATARALLAGRDRHGTLVAMVIAALVTWVAFAVGGALSRPILDLTAAATRMRSGDLTARGSAESDDEIGELTRAFNAMATRLAGLIDGMTARTGELQDEIAARQEREQLLQTLNEELSTARDRALEASRVKSTFLANMSHELRTPLNAIIGYTELLQDDAAANGQQEVVRDLVKIHGAATHLLTIISDILDLSKIEAGKMDALIEPVLFAEVAGEVIAALTPLARKNGSVFIDEIDPAVGVIESDRTKLRQILYNLLSNAAKFTSRGEIRLQAARSVDAATGADELRVVVRDSGIGIPADKLAVLFEPFMQADDSTTRRFGGTGLGLAITRRFCRMLGGEIRVESAAGRGSTFLVTLPARRAGPGERPAEWAVLAEAPTPADGASTVLVVDDEVVVHELMARFLTREGYRVVTARSGAEALRLAREVDPDVITLDVMMPGMDGWAVLTALKRDPELADVPVIVMTIVSDRDIGFTLGAADYLLKPIDRDRLLATLGRFRRASGPASVLIVDDEPNVRELLRRVAERARWSVREAADGREALAALREALPDVVLLDLMMPEVDGFEVIQAMRAEPLWRDVPVIVVTARELSPSEAEFLHAGVHRVLRKGHHSHSALLTELRALLAGVPRPRPRAVAASS